MSTWANNLFYIVFLGQILLTSYVVPKVMLSRMGALLERYPPSTHPKMYPKPVEHYRIGHAVFKWANRLIFMLGFVVLFAVYKLDHGTFADDGYISEAWPAAYGVIQFLPLMWLEFAGFQQSRLMRAANTSGTRKADLRPRRLLDYVSRGLLTLAATMLAFVICFDLGVHDFKLAWGSDAIQRDIVIVITNAMLAAMGYWHLHGRKLDPYQASDDRVRDVRVKLNSLLLVSTALSFFMVFQVAEDVFDLDYLDAPLMSLYFQLIVAMSIGYVLRAINPADIDFSVYASDTSLEKNG